MTIGIQEYYKKLLAAEMIGTAVITDDASFVSYGIKPDTGCGRVLISGRDGLFSVLNADYSLKSDFERSSHVSENYIELGYFETNTASFGIGKQRRRKVGRGLFYYFNNRKTVCVHCPADSRVKFIKLILTERYILELSEKYFNSDSVKIKKALRKGCSGFGSPRLELLFRQLSSPAAAGSYGLLFIEGKILEIISCIMEEYIESGRQKRSIPCVEDKLNLSKSVELMSERIRDCPKIPELADAANMSVNSFQLKFKNCYGKTAYHYLQDLRLKKAAELLISSDIAVSSAAEIVGYRNAGHFAGLFRTEFGMTPAEWRTVNR